MRVGAAPARVLAALLVGACFVSAEREPEDLRQGARVIGYMLRPSVLRRSMFLGLYPQGTASQFVSFLFSGLGFSEWPASEAVARLDPLMAEQSSAIGAPLIPQGVAFTPRSPQSDLGRQIVVRFDDERNRVIVEGFEDPASPPALYREYPLRLPQISDSEREFLRALAGSAIESGAQAQAF